MKKYDREPLTDRHKEVVRLISLGCTVHETAAILKLAPNTVDNHKAEAMRRLGTGHARAKLVIEVVPGSAVATL